jgi:hypothetical protein
MFSVAQIIVSSTAAIALTTMLLSFYIQWLYK